MAFTPYYAPYYNPAMNYERPTMQQPMQTTQPQSDIVWVMGESGAKAFPVAPNNTVTLWDRDSNLIFVKSCDAAGIPSMRVFEWTERKGIEQKTVEGDGFAKVTDLDAIRERLTVFEKQLATLTERLGEDDE